MTETTSREPAMNGGWTCSSGHFMSSQAAFCLECGEPHSTRWTQDHLVEAYSELPPGFGQQAPSDASLLAPPSPPVAKRLKSPAPLYLATLVVGLIALALVLYATVTFTIPDVRGMELSQAAARLEARHLKVGTVSTAPSDEVDKGYVIAQGGPNKRVRFGTPVALVVSEGPSRKMLTLDLEVYGTSFNYGENGTCGSGLTGYWDVADGTSVTIQGDNGETLATGYLSSLDHTATLYCAYTAVLEVPGDQLFYSVTVGSGRRGTMDYSRDELDVNGWEIQLTLGGD